MNEHNRKRKLASNDEIDDNKTSSFEFEAGEGPMEDTIGNGNSNINDELKLKMAALESENASLKAINKLLEGKFEESRAQILLLTEENKALKLMKDVDQEIPNNEKLADLEEQPEEMANNLDQRMEYFMEKLTSLEEKHAKESAELKAKYLEEKKEIAEEIAFLRKQMSIPMKIDLPTEIWHDLFGFVPRNQLARLVPQIGHWHFALKAQYHLHECDRITFGRFDIELSQKRNGQGPVIVNKVGKDLPLADVPIPENVKNFKEITLSFYDKSVLRFLQQFQPNSLFINANVNITMYDGRGHSDALLEFITSHGVTLFTNINSISIGDTQILKTFQNEHSESVMPMLTSSRILKTRYNSRNDWFCEWLKIPRQNGKPRVLRLRPSGFPVSPFIENIKKDFLQAKQAISFFVHLQYIRELSGLNSQEICYMKSRYFIEPDGAPSCQPLSLENIETKEKLVIIRKEITRNGKQYDLWISRYPLGATVEWIEEIAKYEGDDEYRTITIDLDQWE